MQMMDWKTDITAKLVTICNVPDSIDKNGLVSLLTEDIFLLDGQILEIELVPGAEEKKGIQRWIALLNSAESAQALLSMKEDKRTLNKETFTVAFQSSIPCEIPTHWKVAKTELVDQTPVPSDSPPSQYAQYHVLLPENQGYPPTGPVPGQLRFDQMPKRFPLGNVRYPGQQSPQYYPGQNVENLQEYQQYLIPRHLLPKGLPYTHIPCTPGSSNIPPGLPYYQQQGMFCTKGNERPCIFDPTSIEPQQRFTNMPYKNMPGDPRMQQFIRAYYPYAPPQPDVSPRESYEKESAYNDQLPGAPSTYKTSNNEVTHPPCSVSADMETYARTKSTAPVDSKTQDMVGHSQNATKEVTQIVVSNISAKNLNEEMIQMTFESKNYGYLEVISVKIFEETARAIVEFANPEAVEQILQKHPILIGKEEVDVDRYIPDEDTSDIVDESQNAAKEGTQILVSNISAKNLNEEMIQMTFESKNYGYLVVISVKINEDAATAIVEFSNPEAVEQILQKHPILIGKEEVDVDRYIPDEYTSESDEVCNKANKSTKILVSNLPANASDEYLQLFFENRKFGGWAVDNIEMLDDNMAIVEFEEPEAVKKVMESLPVQMSGKTVQVSVYMPEPVCLNTIEVRGPKTVINMEQLPLLQMYFENTKRSRGADVVKSKLDPKENVVYLTFQAADVAKRVVDKKDHQLNKLPLDVKLHMPKQKLPSRVPEKSQTNAKEENKDQSEQQPQCTLKVKGFSKSKSRSTLQYYFENNRRSGGGGDVSVESDEEDKNVLYVSFQEEDIAKRVAAGSHKVEGCDLQVSLHIPPKPKPFYENRMLLKGMNSTTTKEGLFNFLEAKANCLPCDLTYHSEEDGTVMVTCETIDFEKAEDAFRKYRLEGASLKMSRVPVSNCILVSNLPSEFTKDLVEFYFENSRKSGGGQIDKVIIQSCDRACLVYFNDFNVIDAVLHQEHKLSDQKLDVARYLECLCACEGEGGERRLKIPEPIIVLNIEPCKIKFLENSPTNKNAVELQVKTCHAKVEWPVKGNNNVSILCTLNKDMKDCFKLAKTWQKNVTDSFNAFMKNIIINQTNVLQDTWDKVMDKLKEIQISNSEAVALFLDKKESLVTVVGMKHVVDDLAKQIADKIKQVTDQAEREKQKVKETISNMKFIETKMLNAVKFAADMEKKFADMKVTITLNKNEIVFEGVCGDVREAKLEMYDKKEGFAEKCINNLSTVMANLYLSKQTKAYIVKKLKQQNVTAVWVIQKKSLIICSSHKNTLDTCVEIIKGAVIESTISLHQDAQSIMKSEQWNKMEEEWKSTQAGKCQIQYQDLLRNVNICATDDIFNDLLEKVNNFIKKQNTSNKTDVAKGLQGQLSFQVPGRAYERADSESLYETKSANLSSLVRIHARCKAFEIRTIITAEGDITELPVDVLVNTADETLSLSSGIGKAIISKGGFSVKKACADYIKEFGSLSIGDVAMCKSGKLRFRQIAHAVGPAWNGGVADEENALTLVILKCMKKASARNMTSIAIPAVSCGTFGFPVTIAASTIVKAIKNFFYKNQKSSVTDVVLCDANGDVVKKFTDAVSEQFGQHNVLRGDMKDRPKPAPRPQTDVVPCDANGDVVKKFTDAISEQFGQHNELRGDMKDRPKPAPRPQTETMQFSEVIYGSDDNAEYYAPPKLKKPPAGAVRVLPLLTAQSDGIQIRNITVTVLLGEIAKQKVDVIANNTARNLELKNGAVSGSLLKAAGQELQDDIKQKYPMGIKGDEVATTEGHRLKCKMVVHGSLPNWNEGDSSSVKALHSLTRSCLEEADKQNFTSVAFPALGTGNLGFPRDVAAKEMFVAIWKFAKDFPQSSVNDIRIILYQNDINTIQAFRREEQFWKTGERIESASSYRQTDDKTVHFNPGDVGTFQQQNCKYISNPKQQKLARILDFKYWLTDDDIDAASGLIRQTYPMIKGLQDICVLTARQGIKVCHPFVQILHSGLDHWVTATSIKCNPGSIFIYDSTFRNLQNKCLQNIIHMLDTDDDSEQITVVTLPAFQVQKNKSDCGLFAIAAAFALALGGNPAVDKYDIEQLRPHFLNCLEMNKVIEFPKYNGPIKRYSWKELTICCYCRCLVSDKYETCHGCKKRCHTENKELSTSCSLFIQDMLLCKKCHTKLSSK